MVHQSPAEIAATKATAKVAEAFNNHVQGMTIVSVEPGRTPGWVVINFETQNNLRNFLTLWVGSTPPRPIVDWPAGSSEAEEEKNYWEIAMHKECADGFGIVAPIRKISANYSTT
jgi:hypothetical protein